VRQTDNVHSIYPVGVIWNYQNFKITFMKIHYKLFGQF
jgi:hypothetical protein